MKPFLIAAALAAPLAAMVLPSDIQAQGRGGGRGLDLAPGQEPDKDLGLRRASGKPIPKRFIVILQPRENPRTVAAENGIEPDFVYENLFKGFAGTMAEIARLRRDNRVVSIEEDSEQSATAVTWGVDRVDQRALPLSGTYSPLGTGAGTTVYVLDTGIRADHVMFEGRASYGLDVIGDGRSSKDCDGHGTHVAGTVAGGQGYGVAPGARIVAMRVLNCTGSGSTSGIIYALDWVAAYGRRPAVVNMSLGGSASASLDDAIRRLVSRGVTTVVAAGNESTDACSSSPARAADAIAVAASDKNDARASFSNYGSCVDIFAPGVSIVSAHYGSTTGLASASGTSMASPHVAGAAAVLLGNSPSLTPTAVRTALLSSASPGVVAGSLSPTSALLFIGSSSATPTPRPRPHRHRLQRRRRRRRRLRPQHRRRPQHLLRRRRRHRLRHQRPAPARPQFHWLPPSPAPRSSMVRPSNCPGPALRHRRSRSIAMVC